MDFFADSTFLVGRWRKGRSGPEQAFIDRHPDAMVGITWVVKGEFLRGAALAGHEANVVRAFLARYRSIWPDEETIGIYAGLYAALHRRNHLLGPHDLWIAASSLRHGVPILSANVSEFRRVPDLKVVDYREEGSAA